MRRLTALVLLVPVLAACRAADATAPGLPPGPATFAAGTARVTVHSSDGRTTVDGEGVVDLADRSSSMTFDRFDAIAAGPLAYLRRQGATAWRTVARQALPQADPVLLLQLLGDTRPRSFERVDRDRYRVDAGSVTITIWLDGRGRVRQERVRYGDGASGSTTTIRLSRFGAPVHVRVPAHARRAQSLVDALG